MTRELFEYQKIGVDFLKSQSIALLADEPGLGKTVQALKSLGKGERALIICPAAVRQVWKDEAESWLDEDITCRVLTRQSARSESLVDLYVVSYNGVTNENIFNKIKCLGIKTFIIDEAHYLKNSKTQRFKKILGKGGIITKMDRVILLTGTPIINRPSELYGWMSKLVSEKMGRYANYFNFVKHFCAGKTKLVYYRKYGRVMSRKVLDTSGSSNEADLSNMLSSFCLRRKKSEVLKELPRKYYQVVELETSSKASKILKIESELLDSLSEQECQYRINFGEIAKIRKEIAMLKLSKALEFIKDALETNEKIVIFCHHREIVRRTAEKLTNFSPVLLIGGMTQIQQKKSIDSFMENDKVRIFIGNIQSAGVGITLTRASTIIFMEMPFSPADINQCTDRCHRIGQQNAVLAQFLVFKDSFDSFMIKNLIKKLNCIKGVFN